MHDLALHSTAGADACGAGGLFGLSLCAGVGGLDLGLMLAEPGYRTVGYVERDAFAAAVLVARMEDEALDQAPVWNDVAVFDGRPWRGAVDVLTAGYPCQSFSVAGRRQGTDDPRHLWPHVARVIDECESEWVFLENVANHLNLGYREVRGELEGLGFRVTEGLFTAAEVGAPHRRQRLFILAHAERGRRRQPAGNPDPQGKPFRPSQRQEGHLGLDQAARMWPTPRACSGKRSSGCNRTELVRAWATPMASDGVKPSGGNRRNLDLTYQAKDWTADCRPSRPDPTTGTDGETASASGLTLNPLFVEALMGWPTAWTGFGSVGTEWCRWSRRMRGELSRLGLSISEAEA